MYRGIAISSRRFPLPGHPSVEIAPALLNLIDFALLTILVDLKTR
jgi:hypothetical protein